MQSALPVRREHSKARNQRPRAKALVAASAAVALGLSVLAPTTAAAYPTPGPISDNGDPARFLPAPNETAYCESVDYFGPWDKNVALAADANTDIEPTIDQNGDGNFTNDTGNQSIVTDTSDTGPTDVVASFQRLTTGANNGGVATPSILSGINSDLGIVMNAPAKARISLSEPMFYSQWVFTDIDSRNEGFQVTPQWATTSDNQILLTSAITEMNSSGDENSMRFTIAGDDNSDGYLLKGRAQADFLGAISGYDFEKVGGTNAGSGFVGGSGCLPFGVSKSASEPVFDEDSGTFSVDYTISVRNTLPTTEQLSNLIDEAIAKTAGEDYDYLSTGKPEGIDQTVMQIADELQVDGFQDVAISDLSGDNLSPNTDFNGTSETNLLTGTDTLAPQTTGTVTFTATYTPDIENAVWDDCEASISNSATATAQAEGIEISDASDDGDNPVPTDVNGGGTTDDPTPVSFKLKCAQEVEKSVGTLQTDADGSGDISAGDTLSYTVTATNTGAANLSNVVVNDPALTPDSTTCAKVAPNDTCVLTGTYVVTEDDVAAGQKTNTATANADQTEEAEEDTSITPITQPAMALAKSDGELTGDADGSGDISVGDTLTYTLTATNTGTANLTDIAISDPLLTMTPDPFVCAGPVVPGDTCVATGTYVVTADDVETGHRHNTGSAVADQISTEVEASSTTPIGSPKLTFTKSEGELTGDADGSGDISAGDTLTYTLTATNTGTAALTGLTISDPDVTLTPDPYVCASPLDPTEVCVATGTYVVTAEDVAAGFKSNTATADAVQTEEVTDTSITSIPHPEMELEKSTPTLSDDADGSGDISVGDTLSYTITASNTGEATLTDVVVADPLVTPNSQTCATVAPGDDCVLNGTYVVTAEDVADGRIDNTATGDSDQTDELTDSKSIAVPVPHSVLTKSAATLSDDADGSGDISAGDELTYTVRLTNTGASNLTNVTVSDPLLTPNSNTCAGPLAPGDVCELTGSLTVSAADVAAGELINTASGDSDQTPEVTAEEVTPIRTPGLTIDKSHASLENDNDSSGDISVGDDVRFTITATNTGTANLTNVVVTDDHISPSTNTCAGPVAPGGTCELTGLYRVGWDDVVAGEFTNTASATADQADEVTDSVVTKLNQPALGIDKLVPTNADEDGSGDVSVGDTLTYTITATNIGTANLTGVSLADPMITVTDDECSSLTLEPGDTCDLIGTYVVTEADVAAGQIENLATGTSDQTEEVTDEVTVVVQTPGLEIVKSEATNADEDGSGDVSVGDTLSYTVTATNVGGANLTNVVVSDPQLDGDGSKTCAGPLATGETCELTGTHVVTAEDVAEGAFTNTATATSTQTGEETDTIVTPAPKPGLTVIKEYTSNADEDGSEDISAGDTLTYTVTATNVGAANLTDVEVTDAKLTPAAETCPGPLASGETCVLTGTYTVTDDDVTAGSIDNTASGGALQITSEVTDEITVNLPSPAMTLLKKTPTNADEDGSGDISAGDTLTYTVEAHNTGTANLTNVVITDNKIEPSEITCIGPIGPGDSCELVGTYTVTADDVVDGQIINEAAAVSDQTGEATAERVVGVPEPVLGLEKALPTNADEDGSGDISAGDTLTYTVTATNIGQANLMEIEINDPMITPDSATCAGPLSIGETCVLTGTYTVTSDDIAAGSIDNTATATSLETSEEVSAEISVPVYEPVLSVEKPEPVNADEDGSGDISEGDTLTYTITATNAGGASLTNVTITDEMLTPDASTCEGPLLTGETCVLEGTYTVTAEDILAGLISNTATADSDQTDEVSDEVSVATTGRFDLAVTKTVDRNEVSVDDEVTYTITVTNNGPAGALDVQVEDQQPSGLEFLNTEASMGTFEESVWTVGDLAVDESATLTVTAKVTDAGTITNTASASAVDSDGDRASEADMENNVAAVKVNASEPSLLEILRPNLPQTGGQTILWVLFGVAALAGGIALVAISRRRKARD